MLFRGTLTWINLDINSSLFLGNIVFKIDFLLLKLSSFSKYFTQASLVVQTVKNLPAMQESWIRFMGWEDPLEKGMATHSSILAWRIPWA